VTKEEAWEIIRECTGWNKDQRSTSLIFDGIRTDADNVFDNKRKALADAWAVVGELNY